MRNSWCLVNQSLSAVWFQTRRTAVINHRAVRECAWCVCVCVEGRFVAFSRVHQQTNPVCFWGSDVGSASSAQGTPVVLFFLSLLVISECWDMTSGVSPSPRGPGCTSAIRRSNERRAAWPSGYAGTFSLPDFCRNILLNFIFGAATISMCSRFTSQPSRICSRCVSEEVFTVNPAVRTLSDMSRQPQIWCKANFQDVDKSQIKERELLNDNVLVIERKC